MQATKKLLSNSDLKVWEIVITSDWMITRYRFFEIERVKKFMSTYALDYIEKGCSVEINETTLGELKPIDY